MRDLFQVPKGTYLLSHSVGPVTRAGLKAIEESYIEPFKSLGGEAWPHWLNAIDGFCDCLADLLGGQAQDFCPQTNLSSGFTKYLTALPLNPTRNKILMHANTFPTMGFVVQALAARGYELNLIDNGLDASSPQVWLDHVDDHTEAALLTHVYSNTGQLTPVADISKALASKGVSVIVDIAQSVGIIPIDLNNWHVDAVFGSCVKWLCGGPGAGFMWVNPEKLAVLEPEDVGWFSHANPFEFDIHRFEYAKDSKRFLGGTPSVVPFVMATGSIRVLNEIGVSNIRERNIALMRKVKPDLDPVSNGGTLCLNLGKTAEAISKQLKDANVFHDRRGDTLRLSFHVFNSEDEAEQVAEILKT